MHYNCDNKREYNSDRRRKPKFFTSRCKLNLEDKREYNSDRRRKLYFLASPKLEFLIRENITPIGDGNYFYIFQLSCYSYIRENITPIGDGNPLQMFLTMQFYYL